MWIHLVCRRRHALRAAPCLALSLLLMPVVGSAIEPAVRAQQPVSLTATPRIGRIFFSPMERRSRHTKGLGAAPATPTARTAPQEHLHVNGALSSSTQGRAVWINGAAVENSGVNKAAWTEPNGNIWLINGTQGTHLLKPGQSIDRSGAVEDLLPPGSVTRH
jgi:hypothetical protein